AAIGIDLSATATTHVAVTASDGTNSNTVSQDITWTVTDLAGKSSSSDTVTIRKGDSLLLTASGSGSVLTIDADGDSIVDITSVPGAATAFQYATAGTFIATAKIDGTEVGTLTVVVVDVQMNKAIAAEVGFERINDVTKDM